MSFHRLYLSLVVTKPALCIHVYAKTKTQTSSDLTTDFLLTRLNYNTCSYLEVERDLLHKNVWFVWFEVLRPI